MLMVLGRNHVLPTTKGHMIRFKKGEPVNVPAVCVSDAVAIGAQPADGQEINLIPDPPPNRDGPMDQPVREKALTEALEQIIAMNARKDFTAAGLPSVEAMTRVAGFDVGAAERNVIWQRYCDMKATTQEE